MAGINNLREKIAEAPDSAGVYLMKDQLGRVIYIGKAKSLVKRLSTYLGRGLSAKTAALMSHVSDIDYKLCQNEGMALLLEASLIRQYKPKYNVSLRDDKSFPYVKVTAEEFPAVFITRKTKDDRAQYLGPYTDAKLLREALKIIRRSFPYRSCKTLPKKACLYYRIKLSPAPCIGKISRQDYAKTIENICLILEGGVDDLIQRLSAELKVKSGELKFEEAAGIRDKIKALSAISQNQAGGSGQGELYDLKGLLGLDKLPERIEAFDISNISGKEACGSMVSFYRGRADKDSYRRFRIKTVSGVNDYAMLREVVRRRYLRLIEEKRSLPDLVLIDGGRAHLTVAAIQLGQLGLRLPVASIAKDRENIYTSNRLDPIKLDTDTPALNLIRRIRDEAHRFAVAYHHILRRKKIIGK